MRVRPYDLAISEVADAVCVVLDAARVGCVGLVAVGVGNRGSGEVQCAGVVEGVGAEFLW